MLHAKNSSSIWHSISSDSILNFCRFSNGPFLNLGATCFRTEWWARANFRGRRLLLRDSPSSQPPSLPKSNFGTASPTRCSNYSVLPESKFWHTFCTLVLRRVLVGFKLVDFLCSELEMPCSDAGCLHIFLQIKWGVDHALTHTASDIRVRPQGCRPLAAAADSELRVTEAGRFDSERVTVESGMDHRDWQPASEYWTQI